MRILVKGAGVAGLTVAWQLYRHGFDVTVAERADKVAGGASGLAGGMLAPWCERESAEEPVLTLGRQAADWWEAALPGHVHRKGTRSPAGRAAGNGSMRPGSQRWNRTLRDASARPCSSGRKPISTRAWPFPP